MNIVLWILQVLLAALFVWHGWLFLAPPPELVEIMNKEFALWFRMFLGVAEVLAAVGLIVPGVTRFVPLMVPVTAVCLMIVMVGATIFHSVRGETGSAITTAALFAILAFVAYMRWKVETIARRTCTHSKVFGPSLQDFSRSLLYPSGQTMCWKLFVSFLHKVNLPPTPRGC
jgi:uncharacterized membrane protein YphA (DoxX/SURF4 family)